MFCFNCGGSLAEAEEPSAIPPPAEPIAARPEPAVNGIATKVDTTPARTERSDRRKVRASNREPVEIVWEPREGVSWTFVIASIVFVIIAFAMVIAAVYVK